MNQVRRNSDRRIRDLERRWQETGSEEDQRRWIHARVRVGDPLARLELQYLDELAEVEQQVHFIQNERGWPKLMFPQARRWEDLFLGWTPDRRVYEIDIPPDELESRAPKRKGRRSWNWRLLQLWVADHTQLVTPSDFFPGGTPGPGRVRAALSADPNTDQLRLTVYNDPPAQFAFLWATQDWRTEEDCVIPIGPFMRVPRSPVNFFVRAKPEVYQALIETFPPDCSNDYSFSLVFRGEEGQQQTALITCGDAGISDRWLAIIPTLEVPGHTPEEFVPPVRSNPIMINPGPDERLRELERAARGGDSAAAVALDRELARSQRRASYYAKLLLEDFLQDIVERDRPKHDERAGPILTGSPANPKGPVIAGPDHGAQMFVPGPFGRRQGLILSLEVQNSSISYVRYGLRDQWMGRPATMVRLGMALPAPRDQEDHLNPYYWFWRNTRRWDLTVDQRFKRVIPPRFETETLSFAVLKHWDEAIANVTEGLDELYRVLDSQLDTSRRLIEGVKRSAGSLEPQAVYDSMQHVSTFNPALQPLLTVPGPVIGQRAPGRVKPFIQAWNLSGDGMAEAAITCLAEWLQRNFRAVILNIRGDAYNSESGWFAVGEVVLTSRRARNTRNPLRIRVIWDRVNNAWRDLGDAWIGNSIPPEGLWSIQMIRTPATAAEFAAPAEDWIRSEFPDALVQVATNYVSGTTRPRYHPPHSVGNW